MNSTLGKAACCLTLIFLFSGPALAEIIITVPDDQPTIKAAVEAASQSQKTTIRVRAGTYIESLILPVDKEIEITADDPSQRPVISGALMMRMITSVGPLESPLDKSIIRSVIFQDGRASDRGGAIFCDGACPKIIDCDFLFNNADLEGGAIYIENAAPVIENSRFTSNMSQKSGGAVYVLLSPNFFLETTLVNNTFLGNITANRGGGAAIGVDVDNNAAAFAFSDINFNNNTFSQNMAQFGGGFAIDGTQQSISLFSAGNFNGNTFDKNHAFQDGGGMFMETNIGFYGLRDNLFTKNEADRHGGGIYAIVGSLTLFRNNRFDQNVADSHGGAIAMPKVIDFTSATSLITRNSAGINGGGLYLVQADPTSGIGAFLFQTRIFSNTIADNEATASGGGVYVADAVNLDVHNSIIWGNSSAAEADLDIIPVVPNSLVNQLVVQFSDLQDLPPAHPLIQFGATNISDDPLFKDVSSGDYHLKPDSPCRHVGNLPVLITLFGDGNFDFEGDQRNTHPIAGTTTIGVDEYRPHIEIHKLGNILKLTLSGLEPDAVASLFYSPGVNEPGYKLPGIDGIIKIGDAPSASPPMFGPPQLISNLPKANDDGEASLMFNTSGVQIPGNVQAIAQEASLLRLSNSPEIPQ